MCLGAWSKGTQSAQKAGAERSRAIVQMRFTRRILGLRMIAFERFRLKKKPDSRKRNDITPRWKSRFLHSHGDSRRESPMLGRNGKGQDWLIRSAGSAAPPKCNRLRIRRKTDGLRTGNYAMQDLTPNSGFAWRYECVRKRENFALRL